MLCDNFLFIFLIIFMLFPSTYSTYYVAVLDGGLGFLYAGFQLSEAVGEGKEEVTTIFVSGVVTPTENITLDGTGSGVLILVLPASSILQNHLQMISMSADLLPGGTKTKQEQTGWILPFS